MAYTDIDKPTDYFETTTYAGGTTSITSLDFSPDWVWAKKRTGAENHGIFDSVRGATKTINSNTTSAETTRGGSLTSFDSNGWSMGGADGIISSSGNDYVAWAWRGSDSSAVSNTNGDITSTVSANTTSGFSIVSYTGTGANATVGHGLGVAPNMIINKCRSAGQNWATYHSSLGGTKALFLDGTDAETTSSSYFNNTDPTSLVFSVGNSGDTNLSSGTHISYCFAEKKGFSKFGSYIGNGDADGTFVYTGFKPAFLIAKKTNTTSGWGIFDNKRTPYNVMNIRLLANSNGVDDISSDNNVDFVSNGIKFRSSAGWNASASYIYMAFAENPFVSSTGIPTTAR